MLKSLVLIAIACAVLANCPNEKNCRACVVEAGGNKCYDCYLGWVNAQGMCAVLPVKDRLDNCLQYNQPTKEQMTSCALCKPGFYVDNGKCVQCALAGCGLCTKSGECSACLNGNKLQVNPEQKCLQEPSAVANCYLCDYFSGEGECRCRQCNPGYALNPIAADKEACVKDKIGSCHILDKTNTNRCAYCMQGYYIGADGKCWNDNQEVYGWTFWIVLFIVILVCPLIWWCVKNRGTPPSGDYHQHSQPLYTPPPQPAYGQPPQPAYGQPPQPIVNNNQNQYSTRLVN